MNKYYLKPYFPIQKIGNNNFFIGIPGTDTYLLLENSKKNNTDVYSVLYQGINEMLININPIYKKLMQKNMLIHDDNLIDISTRNRMFFDFLNMSYNDNIFLTNILIIGVGGGGSIVAFLLAQFGFKNITLVDNDMVEKSDIIKTMIFRNEHIGISKVEALKKIILENFGIETKIIKKKIYTKKQINKIVQENEIQFIVKAADPNLNFRLLLNDVALLNKIPVIHMSYSYHLLNIGPLYIPSGNSCDLIMNEQAINQYGSDFDFKFREKLFENKIIHPSVTFNINMLGSIVFKEIVFFLSGNIEYVNSIDTITYFSPLSMKGYSIKLKCNNNCICQINKKSK